MENTNSANTGTTDSINVSELPVSGSFIDSSLSESPSLNDVLEAHLAQCKRCQESLGMRPVPNVNGKTKLCSEWFDIIKEYADYEGLVNNVVARDEFGNDANGSRET